MRTIRPLLLLLLGGCGSLAFTEADEGLTKEVARGAAFKISLPKLAAGRRTDPKIQGAFIRFLGSRVDESAGLEVFEFEADGLGEGDIRIAAPAASGSRIVQSFVLRVRVLNPEGAKMRTN